jgi:hypothetical protein
MTNYTMPIEPFSIPLPPPEAPQQPSTHYYITKTWVGSTSLGDTAAGVFEQLRNHAAPGQTYRINDNGDLVWPDGTVTHDTTLSVFGPVKHVVFPDEMTIVNTTMEGHIFDPGNVWRRVVQEGDNFYIVTEGYGQGPFGDANQFLGPKFWPFVDLHIYEALHIPPEAVPDSNGMFPVGSFKKLEVDDSGQQTLTVGQLLPDSSAATISGAATVANNVASFSNSDLTVTTGDNVGATVHLAAGSQVAVSDTGTVTISTVQNGFLQHITSLPANGMRIDTAFAPGGGSLAGAGAAHRMGQRHDHRALLLVDFTIGTCGQPRPGVA